MATFGISEELILTIKYNYGKKSFNRNGVKISYFLKFLKED